MRMRSRLSQNIFNNSAGELSRALILLLNDFNQQLPDVSRSLLSSLARGNDYFTPLSKTSRDKKVLGAECWVLGAECWVLGAECWVLGAGC